MDSSSFKKIQSLCGGAEVIKMNIATLIGTRPEIIRLSQVIKRLDGLTHVNHILIHTGQNYDYELNQIFFDDLSLRAPDVYLEAAGKSATATIGQVLIKLDAWLEDNPLDAFLVLGDTNSALGALAAKKRKISVFHCEAGNRSFDERVPEEINRRIVDHFADVNLPYSSNAKEYLLAEGISPNRIITSGSPIKEVLEENKSRINSSQILQKLSLTSKQYFVVSAHREENVSQKIELSKLITTLNLLAKKYSLPIIVSTHPRTKKELDSLGITLDPNISLVKPLGYCDYIQLQQHSKCVLSDSGSISEECALLGFPAVNLRYSQERPEAFELGVLPLVGLEFNEVMNGMEFMMNRTTPANVPIDYQTSDFSNRVVNAILSHIQNKA